MSEIIEGEAVEVIEAPPMKALTTLPSVAHVQSGLGAIALLSDEDFERNLIVLGKGAERARRIQKAILEAGTDYGAEPGIKRPFLHKPGAEKFEKAYGLATSYTVERHVGDGEESPDLEFIVHGRVHLGTTDGPVIAEGLGEASSWERKYRYRSGSKACPTCGVDAIRRGNKRETNEPEFYCWAKQGGCGAHFPIDTPELAQAPDDVQNPDPWDLANTLLKMARKRAYVDAILTATGTSGLFTQDEDSPAARPPAGPTGPATGPDGARPAQPRPANPEQPAGPGAYTGKVEKVDPPDKVRTVKVPWHPDGGKVAHSKLEVKAVTDRGKITAILLDRLAEAGAEGNLAAGEWVSFDGEYHERVWKEDAPPVKESRMVAHLWRYRDNAWVELTAKSAPAHRVEDDLAELEQQFLEGLEDPVDIPTWEAKVRGLQKATPPDDEIVTHAGYFMESAQGQTTNGSPIWSAVVGVPGIGLFQLVINESQAEKVGLVESGKASFAEGSLVTFTGKGFKGRVIPTLIGRSG
jgi:hypothetical protein